MLLLLVLIVILSVVVAIILFGDSPSLRSTPIHSLHVFLVRLNSVVSNKVLSSHRLYAFLRWLVPTFYSGVVLFCLYQFFRLVYPVLDTGILESHVHSACIAFTIACVLLSTVLVTFSDPGTVTRENVAESCAKYPNNGLIFFGKICSTCHLEKPARSKHCSVCNRCILLYDHHCIWVNNCIGYRNFRWFMAFLILNVVMMVYGAYLCWRMLSYQNSLVGWWNLIVRTTENNKMAGTLCILGLIISTITALFTCLHIRYLYLGVTTNEAEKWGEVEHLVSLGLLYYIVEKKMYVEEASIRNSDGTFEVVYIDLNEQNDHHLTSKDRETYTFLKITLMETDLDNIYDHGFVNNLKERIFI